MNISDKMLKTMIIDRGYEYKEDQTSLVEMDDDEIIVGVNVQMADSDNFRSLMGLSFVIGKI